MKILAAAVIVMPLVGLMVYVLVRNGRHDGKVDGKKAVLPVLLLIDIFIMFAGLSVGENDGARMMLDLTMSMIPLSLLSFSVFNLTNIRRFLLFCAAGGLLLVCFHLSCSFGIVPPAPPSALVRCAVVADSSLVAAVICGLGFRVSNINMLMKSGTVWSVTNFLFDFVYMMFAGLSIVLAMLTSDVTGNYQGLHLYLADILLVLALAGMSIRVVRNSPFILMARQERLVMESMKVSRIELPDTSLKDDSMYRMIYERLTEYFEHEKPFLRSELTINDIVKVIYTNKLYISRSISLCTGRNFRQFVNYYRVMHSLDLYRENPQLKVVELSHACGFNSMASYNMAFRLFMNESPGEWCRHEKTKMMHRNITGGK